MKHAPRMCRLALMALLGISAANAGTELGTLPPQALAHSTAGPADELIGFLLFDPARIRDRIPPGIRLLTLEEKARDWPRLAAYLEAHPDRRGWAWSIYEVIGIHAARYDSLKARFDQGRGGMAVWYPEVAAVGEADPRALGEQTLALGSWVSDPRLVDYMRSRGFPATRGQLVFQWNDHRAEGALEAEGLTIKGHCRLEGPSFIPWWGKDPHSFQTLWTPAGEGDNFEVVTWSGHRSRKCLDAEWHVSGTHPFAMLFNDPKAGDPSFLPTEFAYGYLLESGLYARKSATAENLYTRVAAKLAADPVLAERLGKPGPEMASVSWLLGEWDVVSEVQAPGSPADPEHGVSQATLQLDGTLIEQRDTYPSGTQDLGFLSYSPVTGLWSAVALDSLGNALITRGHATADALLLEGDVTIVGVPIHLRQTFRRLPEGYVLTNEERTADGGWVLLDTYRYSRKVTSPR